MKKRILSMLLVIVMVLSVLPVQALADGGTIVVTGTQRAAVGDVVTFYATVNGTEFTEAEWESDNLSVAVVEKVAGTNQCKITGKGQGAAKITAKKDGYTACERYVSFCIKQESVAIVGPDTVVAGKDTEFSFAVPEGVTNQFVSWTLDEACKTYASIDSATANPVKLTVNADAVGKKVKLNLSFNQAENSKEVEIVAPAPGKITVTEASDLHNVCVGKSLTLTAMIDVNPANADYTVDKEGVVDITKANNVFTVTGKAPGEVTIHFTMTGSQNKKYEGSYKVTVDALKTMEIRADSDAFYAGKQVQLRAFEGDKELTGVVWWCDTPGVANAARETGLLTCVGAGPARVKARLDNYNDAWLPITVEANTLQIQSKADKKAVSQISVGDEIALEVVDAAGDPVTVTSWSSSDNTKATVADGLLKGLTKTDTDVTITAVVNGTNVEQKITVNNKSFTVKNGDEVLSSDSVLTIYVGDTIQLTAVDGKTAYWYSDKPTKANITLNGGELIGLEPTDDDAPVLIKVDVDGHDRVTFQVKVLEKKPLTNVTIDDTAKSPVKVRVGQPRELASVLSALHLAFDPTDATHKDIEWTSDNACLTIEDVDGKAMLTAHAFGNATVTGTYETAAEKKTVTFQVRTFAANGIQRDPTMPLELICGEAMDLKAVLMDAEGNTLETPVQWRLKDNKVIKNLVDLTANRLTAYPQSTYGFDVELEAFVDDTQVEVLPVTIHVIPRTVNIALKKGEEDVTDKTAVLDVKNTDGITIQAEIKPDDARQIVSWQVKDPNGICQYTPSDNAVVIKPISSLKTGTVTVIATAADGTSKTAQTTVQIAKMAETLEILDLKDAPEVNYLRGGETLRLRTSFDNDKTLTDRGIKWEVTGEGKAYASISEDGVLDIAAVSERTTITVTATAKANAAATDSKEITLCPSVKSIKIVRKDGDTLRNVMDYTSDEIELGIEVNPEDGYIDSFVWDSSNKAVAEVDSDGVLTLQGVAGKTQITCTADDGSKVRGIYNLEVVMAAGYVDIEGVEELVSGKSATLKATVYSDDEILAGNQRVIWSVEDVFGNATKAASINSRGRLVAKTVNYGTEVVVYAKSVENGEVIGEHHVTILPKKARTFMAAREGEDGTEILGSTLYMNAGESTVIFGQWFTREDGLYDEYDCTYFSSNSGVAKIYEDGALETLKKGSATITVRATDPDTRNVYTAKFTLKVINTVDHIVISKPDKAPYYVRSGERMNLSATVWSNEVETIKADNQGVTWGVFEENGTGLVATGAAYMTSGGTIVANSVTKNTPVVVVATSKENSSIIGEFPLTIRPAKAYTVTARCENEAGDWVVPSAAVSLEAKSGNTYFTDEIRTNVYVSNPNSGYDGKDLPGAAIVWETSNKDIVKVVDGKLVYTGKTGKVKVTPTFKADNVTYRGNAITLNIVKLVKEDGIEVTKKYANQELYSGKSLVMYANVDKDATIRRVSWSLVGSDDGDVASINASTGLIRARKGLTERYTITVMATAVDGSGVSDTMEVTIYPLTTRVEIITEDDITALEKGETAELTAVLLVGGEEDQANQNAVKWRSSRSSVVYVDKDGNITAKRKGTATIKASATDGSGKYATIKVTVK